MRIASVLLVVASVFLIAAIWLLWNPFAAIAIVLTPIVLIAIWDMVQDRHAVRRNFPVIGHLRYLLEDVRPEISQYFIESETDGRPFNREQRSVVYQRAKGAIDTLPFGTRRDVNEPGYSWIAHSMQPAEPLHGAPRVTVGGPDCSRPYASSLLNISAMSFGSLSSKAILSLNGGAKDGGFAHNTGEGSISKYHREPGGDLIWQIGTGYFGCRTSDGAFDPARFADQVASDQVRMIEVKLSQGAKPGHGGILPGAKVTAEIAEARGLTPGHTVLSPPAHSAFAGPIGLLNFIQDLRQRSGGKPVGFKLCVGHRREFFALTKAMLETGITPDFITVDGAEGGTGAAPLEFSNSVGMPLMDGLNFVHNALKGINQRDRVTIFASGKIISGFDIAEKLALGADGCNSARGMMFAIGCIQALRCNTNACPVGVATQDTSLTRGLVVEDKRARVTRFHGATIESFTELLSAAGLNDPRDLQPHHILRRVSPTEVQTLAQAYPQIETGALLDGPVPTLLQDAWNTASSGSFSTAPR